MTASGGMDDRTRARRVLEVIGPGWIDHVAAKALELFGPSKEMLAVVAAAEHQRDAYGATSPSSMWSEPTQRLLEAVDAYRLTLQPPKRYRVEPASIMGTDLIDGHTGLRHRFTDHALAERVARLLEADEAK